MLYPITDNDSFCGRAAVEERYNWEAESEKLIALYRRLMSEP
tara:strand:- start:1599 stop:1724 length:126 start_codon:yes stop_codon:yes gene_type:complete